MNRIRAAVFVAAFALPCALGMSWLGCASGDEEVDGAPKGKPGSDTGGGGGGDTANPTTTDSGTADTYKPLCPGETGTTNSCASAADLGTIAVGATKNIAEAIPEKGGDLWYKVTFDTLDNLAAHPRVTLTSSDPAIVLELVKSCEGETVGCGDEDAFAVRIKDYEVQYRSDLAADGSFTPATDALVPITVGTGGTVYVRVFRTTGAPSGCEFKLDLSN